MRLELRAASRARTSSPRTGGGGANFERRLYTLVNGGGRTQQPESAGGGEGAEHGADGCEKEEATTDGMGVDVDTMRAEAEDARAAAELARAKAEAAQAKADAAAAKSEVAHLTRRLAMVENSAATLAEQVRVLLGERSKA